MLILWPEVDMATTEDTVLDGFITAYAPEIAALTHTLFDRLRTRIPRRDHPRLQLLQRAGDRVGA